jgi:hypothetical protein
MDIKINKMYQQKIIQAFDKENNLIKEFIQLKKLKFLLIIKIHVQ